MELLYKSHSVLTVNLAVINLLEDNLGRLAVDAAANAVGSAKNFLDGTLQLLRERLEAHLTGNLDDFIKADRLVVLDILLLLAVPWGLLEGLDDERRGGGNDRDGGLTVLDSELDSHAQAFL